MDRAKERRASIACSLDSRESRLQKKGRITERRAIHVALRARARIKALDSTSETQQVRRLVERCVVLMEHGEGDPVDAVCAQAPELRAAVRARIERLRALHLLDENDSQIDELAGFGPYRVLGKIGSGGMGSVWLAEQEEPIRRRLAIKRIKPGMDSEEVVRRFASERHALALMDHAHIAKIFDAGTTPDGRPYFAMEYVEGEPITAFADRHGLDTEARLRLLLPVLDAVQHAHRRGVLHRDLKPSNVLVAKSDNDAIPKVIDFGVARALESSPSLLGTRLTADGHIVGTPEYMSPEQASLREVEVDTRSDVYSLGVLLYELLTGQLPLDLGRLRRDSLASVARVLEDFDPPTPSSRISAVDASSSRIASARCTTPEALRRRLRGELDWICLKALEKDPQRRYGSVDELSADLRAHLEGRDVRAVPPSRSYRLRKAFRRHRVAFAVSAALALAVLVAISGVGFGLVHARDEARIAHADFEDAVSALDSLLARARSEQLAGLPGSTKLLVEFREEALRFCERLLRRRPQQTKLLTRAAQARLDLGTALGLLGRRDEQRTLLERARSDFSKLAANAALSESLRAEVELGLGKTCKRLFEVHAWRKDEAAAEQAIKEARSTLERLRARPAQGARPALELADLHARVGWWRTETDEAAARKHEQRALELRLELVERFPKDSTCRNALRDSQVGQALLCARQSDHDQAAKWIEAAVANAEQLLKAEPDHPRFLEALASSASIRGQVEAARKNPSVAAECFARSIAIGDRLGRDYPERPALHHTRAQPMLHLAALRLATLNPEVTLEAVLALVERARGLNARALAPRPNDLRYQRLQRMLLDFSILLRKGLEHDDAELARTIEEAKRLPEDGYTRRFARRVRTNLRSWRRAQR